ncbi:MAG: hypothetical protein ACI8TP_004624 [Acidimicrobiales bacterium]|jgi:hypothetical protein
MSSTRVASSPDQRRRQLEARWRRRRFAVPYPVDGPKVSLGVAWLAALLLAAYYVGAAAALVLIPVAVLAAVQVGRAWSRQELSDGRAAGLVAFCVASAAWFGALALGAATVAAVFGLFVYAWLSASPTTDARVRLAEILVRAALPVGIAAGSLLILAVDRTPAFVSVVLLVSAYETGDFLVGSGSANAVEGPAAGLVALALVAVGLFVVLPDPFTSVTLPLWAAVVAVCCPLGQVAGSAILPRGDAWAPALRRFDSHLIAAPLWVLFVG